VLTILNSHSTLPAPLATAEAQDGVTPVDPRPHARARWPRLAVVLAAVSSLTMNACAKPPAPVAPKPVVEPQPEAPAPQAEPEKAKPSHPEGEYPQGSPGLQGSGKVDYTNATLARMGFEIVSVETSGGMHHRIKLRVADGNNRFVSGLAPRTGCSDEKCPQWRVFANESHCDVSRFKVTEVQSGQSGPVAVVAVDDFSGSIAGFQGSVVEGIRRFVSKRRRGDAIGIVNFDHRIAVEYPLSTVGPDDTTLLETAFDRYGGATSLYDGMLAGLEEVSKSPLANKNLVVFTDGQDNSSIATTASAVAVEARKRNVRLFVIGVAAANLTELEAVAMSTGGYAYPGGDVKRIEAMFEDSIQVVQQHYLVEYDCANDHVAEVELKLDDNGTSRVLADSRPIPSPLADLPDDLPGTKGKAVLIFFEFDSWKLDDLSPPMESRYAALARLARLNPTWKLQLHGHTDDEGRALYNSWLSGRRAIIVRNHLIRSHGMNEAQFEIWPHGEHSPLSKTNAAENRRVEFSWRR